MWLCGSRTNGEEYSRVLRGVHAFFLRSFFVSHVTLIGCEAVMLEYRCRSRSFSCLCSCRGVLNEHVQLVRYVYMARSPMMMWKELHSRRQQTLFRPRGCSYTLAFSSGPVRYSRLCQLMRQQLISLRNYTDYVRLFGCVL